MRTQIESKAAQFLAAAKSIMQTGDLTIQQRAKNIDFMQKYQIKHQDAISMVRQLEPKNCYAIEPNDNQRYADAEVYKFKRSYDLAYYGVVEAVMVYIKMYLVEEKSYDYIMVISFHRDGELDN